MEGVGFSAIFDLEVSLPVPEEPRFASLGTLVWFRLQLRVTVRRPTLKFSLTYVDPMTGTGTEAVMKPYYRILSLTLFVPLLSAGGCASLTRVIEWTQGMDQAEEPELSDDPVAAAAMRMRSPASLEGEDEPISSTHSDRIRSRYSAPVAETIGYGMDMGEVTSIWGQPSYVDTAGDPSDGNQRWTYQSGLSSRYGLGSKRIVYFENGRVAGWRVH